MLNFKSFIITCLFFFCFSLQAGQQLVCIHGLLGAPWNLFYYEYSFINNGWDVLNWGYSSLNKTIEEHANDLVIELNKLALEKPGYPLHFVCHSMGGLVLRAAVNHPNCPLEAQIGKAVLLGTPNQGASWGRFLEQFSLVKKIGKDKSALQLMTKENFDHLGQFPETMEVMVIAGNFSLNPLIKEDNDGIVTVAETVLSTPHKHVTLYVGHKGMLISKQAMEHVKMFLN